MASTTNEPIPFAGCFTNSDAASGTASDSDATQLVFVGIADDTQSTHLRGCADAPEAMRRAYDGRCFNATTELGCDLSSAVSDLGDMTPGSSWHASAEAYQGKLESLWRAGKIPFIAGGDHAITIPVAAALAVLERPIHVIQVDAHPDLYGDFEGDPQSHACTGARILEMAHVATLTQFGIRTMCAAQQPHRERYRDKLFMYQARETPGPLPQLSHIPDRAAVYITIDVDGFDPAYAPGVSHPVPGGLTSRQALDLVQGGRWSLVGMDVVEVNPARDIHGRTAILGARLLHEGMGHAAQTLAAQSR